MPSITDIGPTWSAGSRPIREPVTIISSNTSEWAGTGNMLIESTQIKVEANVNGYTVFNLFRMVGMR